MIAKYPAVTNRCGACDGRVKTSRFGGMYLVGARAAIAYALCNSCGKLARTSLPPALLAQLDERMEAEARAYGLTTTH